MNAFYPYEKIEKVAFFNKKALVYPYEKNTTFQFCTQQQKKAYRKMSPILYKQVPKILQKIVEILQINVLDYICSKK